MTHRTLMEPSRPGRGFTAYLYGESASLAGSAVSAVALPALAILHLHATPTQIATLAALTHLPAFLLALPAGVLADRVSKKHLMIGADLAAASAVAAVPAAAALDSLSMGVLYAVTLVTGAAGVLHQAAAIALVPQLTTPEQLHRANSRVGAAFAVADSAGTYIGTALVAAVGATRSLLADAASYLVGAWCATRLRPAPGPPPAPRRSLVREISEGLAYTARTPIPRALVLALVVTSAGAGLISTYWAYHLLTTLDMGTTGLGVIMGVSALAALAGALAAPRLVARYRPGRVLLAGFAVCPIAQLPLLMARPGQGWTAAVAAAGGGAHGRRGVRRDHPALHPAGDLPARPPGPRAADLNLADHRLPAALRTHCRRARRGDECSGGAGRRRRGGDRTCAGAVVLARPAPGSNARPRCPSDRAGGRPAMTTPPYPWWKAVPMSDDRPEPLGTAVLLVNPAGQYLLHLRDANKPWICDPGTWSVPGGNREPGESSRQAVERELLEETGLVVPGLVPFTVVESLAPDGRTKSRIQIYLGAWDGDADALPVTEGILYRWFDAATMRWLTMCPWTKEAIDLHQSQREQPAPGPRPGPVPATTPSRSGPSALHVVGGHLYLERDHRVLLGRRHPGAAFGGGLWHTLAGHVEYGEPVRDCVAREALEEAGLVVDPADLDLVHTVHMPGATATAALRLQLFLMARQWEGEPQVKEPQCTTIWQWWPREALPDGLVPYTRAALDGIAAGRTYSELGW